MAFDDRSLNSYVDVAQRIADFRELYPAGSLQPLSLLEPWTVTSIKGIAKDGKDCEMTFIVYTAAAYRTPDDARPGVGCAYEVFPGRTPYTAGSELQNAETAAWGRAIIAALASDSKSGVASREEVQNRRAERDGGTDPQQPSERHREPPPIRAVDNLPRHANGNVKRSQVTSEELDLAGEMTHEQQEEHSAVRKGVNAKLPKADKARQVKLNGADPEDPWADAPPPGPALRAPDAARKLVDVIRMHFERMGITDRDERLVYTGRMVGRELATSKDLTKDEAVRVAERLSRCREIGQLQEAQATHA